MSIHPKSRGVCSTRAGICRHRFSSCWGPTNCGAVHAAPDARLHGTRERWHIQILVEFILPGLAELAPEAMLAQAVEANVRWSVRQILETPEGRERQAEGRFKLVGAIHEIETGRVRLLE